MRELFEVEVVTLGDDQAAAPDTWPDVVNAQQEDHERRIVEMETQFAWLEDLYQKLNGRVRTHSRLLKLKGSERIEP